LSLRRLSGITRERLTGSDRNAAGALRRLGGFLSRLLEADVDVLFCDLPQIED
jgi:hypothetical protein